MESTYGEEWVGEGEESGACAQALQGVDCTGGAVRVEWEMMARTFADDDGEDLRGTCGQWSHVW